MHARRCSLACHHLSEHPVAPEHSRSVCGKAQKASGKCRHITSAKNSDRPTSCKQPPATLPSFHCIKVICPSMPRVVPTAMDRDQMKNLITFHSFLPPPSMLALGLVSSISHRPRKPARNSIPNIPNSAMSHFISAPFDVSKGSGSSFFDAQLQQQNSPKCLRIVAIVKSSCQFMLLNILHKMASSTMHGKIAHLTNVKQTLRSCGGAHGSWPAIVTPKHKNDNDKYGQSREKHGKTTRTLDIVKKQNKQTNSSHSSENTQGFDQKVSHWQSQNGRYNQSTCGMGKQPERSLQILNRYEFMQQAAVDVA